jgi:hypothetical protein
VCEAAKILSKTVDTRRRRRRWYSGSRITESLGNVTERGENRWKE